MAISRNALVHERGDGHALAEPYEETVHRLEEIRRILDTPPLALDVVHVPRVETCSPHDLVGAVAGRMLAGSFSQLPVCDDGRLAALLTAETIARWLGSKLESGLGLVEEEPVAAILEFTEDPDIYRIVPRTSTVFDLLELFDDFAARGKYLDAVLITHQGKAAETPLSIVTTFDIPTLTKAVKA
jgi:CBS domain-containing protein